MEIQFKSEFFKRIFDSEVFTDEMSKNRVLSIDKDLYEFGLFNKEILEDYKMILENSENLESIFFSDIPATVLYEFLKEGARGKILSISNSSLIGTLFNKVDEKYLEGLEELSILGCKLSEEEPTQLRSVHKFKNLKKINLLNSVGLDIEDFMQNLSGKEKLESISLSEPLPNPKVLEEYTGLKIVKIHNVKNPEMLKRFLEALPLETLNHFELVNCNLEFLSEEIILRLNSLKTINLINNSNVNYNMIFDNIPKKKLIDVEISAKDNGEEFDVEKLNEFSIIILSLSNFNIDYEKFKKVINDRKIGTVLKLTDCGVKNLDFLQNSQLFNIIISQEDIDFSILTPELAQKLKKIALSRRNTNEFIETQTASITKNGIISMSELSLRVNDTTLSEIEHLAMCMKTINSLNVEMTGQDVSIIEQFIDTYGFKLDWNYIVQISDFSKLDQEKIARLNKEKRLEGINVIDKDCDGNKVSKRHMYSPEKYIELKELVAEIIKGIEPDMTDLQKFMIIYRRLGSNIKYDYNIIGVNQYSSYAKENVDNCRNMVNGLIRKTCVCAGYADILYNCLREVGIEAYKVTGSSGKEWHQWNKVKIDGVLYNTDLTWDAENLADNCLINLKNCLVSDLFFQIQHKECFGIKDKCPSRIPKKQIQEALRFALEFDGIEPKTLFGKALDELREVDILEELKKAYESFKETWRVEILPELKGMFSRKKALPPPIEKTNLNESLKEKVEDTKESETNPWVVEDEIKNKVNRISHESVNPIKNLNVIDKEVSDE